MKTRKLIIILCLTSLLLWSLQQSDNFHRRPTSSEESFDYIPKASVVRMLSLGHHESMACLLWIRTVIYFGDRLIQGKKADWVLHMSRLVIELNPRWQPAYKFTANLFRAGDPSDTTDLYILKKGAETFPDDWIYSLYYSMRLVEKDSNWVEASRVMAPFSHKEGTPAHIKNVSRTYKLRTFPVKNALGLLLEDYVNPSMNVFQKGTVRKIRRIIMGEKQMDTSGPADELLLQFRSKKISTNTVFKQLLLLRQNRISRKH